MSKLLDYINHLDKNSDARNAHAADPAGHMTSYGLSQDEQDALLSGDKQRVADAIGIPAHQIQALHIPDTPF
ncbi:MAG TPA: hypothetical protein VIF60_06835 [Burkholderiaceae bacterium]|jgi:hypothetical protein